MALWVYETHSPLSIRCTLWKEVSQEGQMKRQFTHTLEVTDEDVMTWIHQGKVGECMNRFCEMIVGSANSSISGKFLYFGIMRPTRQERCCKEIFVWKWGTARCRTPRSGYDLPQNWHFKIEIEFYWCSQYWILSVKAKIDILGIVVTPEECASLSNAFLNASQRQSSQYSALSTFFTSLSLISMSSG